MDSSLIVANASRNSVIQAVASRELKKLDEPEEENSKDDRDLSGGGPINKSHRSTTDPESPVVRHRSGRSTPSYKNHRTLCDKARVIVAMTTTTGSGEDAHELPTLLTQSHANTGQKASTVVADSHYGTIANFITLARQSIAVHAAERRAKMRIVRTEGIYESSRFEYNSDTDTYQCPGGKTLRNHHYVPARGYHEYRAERGACAACSLRTECTRDKAGRSLKRYPQQELLDLARKQSQSKEAKADRRRRQWFQEGNFGEAATQHGYKRSRWRGLVRLTIQDLLIASLQNLKILLRQGDSPLVNGALTAILLLLRKLMVEKRYFGDETHHSNQWRWASNSPICT